MYKGKISLKGIKFENLGKALETSMRALSRIPEQEGRSLEDDIESMGINDFIAMNSVDTSRLLGLTLPVKSPDYPLMYAYLRDYFGAKTVSEGAKVISEGRVSGQVINQWITKGYCVNDREFKAVNEGYPELRKELVKERKEYFSKFGLER